MTDKKRELDRLDSKVSMTGVMVPGNFKKNDLSLKIEIIIVNLKWSGQGIMTSTRDLFVYEVYNQYWCCDAYDTDLMLWCISYVDLMLWNC